MMRTALLTLVLTALAACGSSVTDTPSGPVNVTGTWKLRNVNGSVLPFTFPPSQGSTTTYLQSIMTIAPNGTYTEVLTRTVTSASGTQGRNLKMTGTWTADGGTVTIDDKTDKVTFQALVNGGVMTAEIVPGFKQTYELTGPVLIAPDNAPESSRGVLTR